jgi:riboflavin kinase/FMN adenylyltransferase
VYVQHFDAAAATESAKDFVRRVLVETLSARHVLVGEDFRFAGAARATSPVCASWANSARLHRLGPRTQWARGRGSPPRAFANWSALATSRRPEELLGHPVLVEGVVEHGDAKGRELGYPTANLRLSPATCNRPTVSTPRWR